jgi:hypothetical protein
MVDEIKEYYNLNDTLLASDLGIMQQTIRGWRDGRKPNLDNYNKVKKMYDEMKREAVDESIVQRFEALEEKVENKPYEVEFPEDINHLAYLDEDGYCIPLEDYDYKPKKNIYIRGLAFGTREEAERYDRERILLFKMHKWAEEYNGEWTPNWNDYKEEKWTVMYHNECEEFEIYENYRYREFLKLPYFESEEIAELFIKEFGDEIKEVLC